MAVEEPDEVGLPPTTLRPYHPGQLPSFQAIYKGFITGQFNSVSIQRYPQEKGNAGHGQAVDPIFGYIGGTGGNGLVYYSGIGTLVSQENYITYNPLLPEVVGASILPGHVIAPHRQMIRRSRVCMARVTDIDYEQRVVHYLGEGSGTLPFDHLVLACGVNANLALVKGMEQHALPLTFRELRSQPLCQMDHVGLLHGASDGRIVGRPRGGEP